ncbi:uncharacterized protein PG998_011577 [Apiospora kogelbergensis]|uniref:uncharacterized protein n=1 Tax=Apiospora kogelbergensis TaxID=1337665 RepID=UPI00312D8929
MAPVLNKFEISEQDLRLWCGEGEGSEETREILLSIFKERERSETPHTPFQIPQDATVCFLNGTKEEQNLIKGLVEEHYNRIDMAVRFRFVPPSHPHPIAIRIAVTKTGVSITWTGARLESPQVPNMVINLTQRSPNIQQSAILHSFAIALGMGPQHKHPDSGIIWNDAYYEEQERRGTPTYDPRLEAAKPIQYFATAPYDRDSIMHDAIPTYVTTNLTEDIPERWLLSRGDKEYLMSRYPKSSEEPPPPTVRSLKTTRMGKEKNKR